MTLRVNLLEPCPESEGIKTPGHEMKCSFQVDGDEQLSAAVRIWIGITSPGVLVAAASADRLQPGCVSVNCRVQLKKLHGFMNVPIGEAC